jgi:acetyltransferase-like isoleucine patch superfamily enzyme
MDAVTGSVETRAPTLEEPVRQRGGIRLLAIRLANYVTNHLVCHVPSFTLRRLWYARVLGIALGPHAGIHLGCYVWYYTPRQIRRSLTRIGAYSRVNRGCTLDVRGGLEIGENVSISPEVVVLTAGHRHDVPGFALEHGRVVIEDSVWIGTRALVLPGVRLGRGCVVAAGAVVTEDVEPLAVVAGVPARKVRERPEAALEYTLDIPFPLFE